MRRNHRDLFEALSASFGQRPGYLWCWTEEPETGIDGRVRNRTNGVHRGAEIDPFAVIHAADYQSDNRYVARFPHSPELWQQVSASREENRPPEAF